MTTRLGHPGPRPRARPPERDGRHSVAHRGRPARRRRPRRRGRPRVHVDSRAGELPVGATVEMGPAVGAEAPRRRGPSRARQRDLPRGPHAGRPRPRRRDAHAHAGRRPLPACAGVTRRPSRLAETVLGVRAGGRVVGRRARAQPSTAGTSTSSVCRRAPSPTARRRSSCRAATPRTGSGSTSSQAPSFGDLTAFLNLARWRRVRCADTAELGGGGSSSASDLPRRQVPLASGT